MDRGPSRSARNVGRAAGYFGEAKPSRSRGRPPETYGGYLRSFGEAIRIGVRKAR